MNPLLGWAIVWGLVLGLGLWSLMATLPSFARPRLVDRLAPQLTDISEVARTHTLRRDYDPLPVFGTLAAPLVLGMRRLLAKCLGGDELVRHRLRRAGLKISLERYRTEQAVSALAGLIAGVLLALPLLQGGASRLLAAIVLPLLCAGGGAAVRELVLRHRERHRMHRIASEYPTVLEFFTLSLAAGEGIHDALGRVGRLGASELGSEFASVVRRTRTGVPLGVALQEMGRDLSYPALERTCDHLVTALERGAPLIDVLRAQASDARELAKRDLLEQGGRNEIRMMVPLVMLVLPVTVLFAAYPSYFVLTTTF